MRVEKRWKNEEMIADRNACEFVEMFDRGRDWKPRKEWTGPG
jgi:hypothetical protein